MVNRVKANTVEDAQIGRVCGKTSDQWAEQSVTDTDAFIISIAGIDLADYLALILRIDRQQAVKSAEKTQPDNIT